MLLAHIIESELTIVMTMVFQTWFNRARFLERALYVPTKPSLYMNLLGVIVSNSAHLMDIYYLVLNRE